MVRGENGNSRFEQDVFGFQIAMNDLGLLQHGQGIEELRRKDANETRTETTERILLDELVEIVGEELENEAEVGVVNEGVLEPKHVVLVVLVPLVVDLRGKQPSQYRLFELTDAKSGSRARG